MNIFVLDTNVGVCAQYHVDRHCIKMILEGTQLLNNAVIKHHKDYVPIYKKTHFNHPASIWTSETYENFIWLTELSLELCKEYTYRYDKTHKCEGVIKELLKYKNYIPKKELTPFALCMPDEYKSNDAVTSYRKYYKNGKAHLAKWTKRDIPFWWNDV